MVAAVVVKSGRVLSIAVNRWRSLTHVGPEYLTYHAEEQAISGVADPTGTTVYIARKGRNGLVTMARPCEKKCFPMLRLMGVRQVVYTTYNGRYAIENVQNTLS